MGRPSTFTPEIADEICERLANGEPLRAICRDDHMPAWRTVYDWVDAHSDFATRIARAREVGFDAIAEDTVELIDEVPERTETQFGSKVDAGHVQWQKNRVEQRMKLLAKWCPQKYGDKQAVELTGHLAVSEMTDDEIRAELAALTAGGVLPTDSDVSDLI